MRADDRAPAPGQRDLIEEALVRLREAVSILDAIERASLLAELPADPEAADRHQCGVSMLAVLRRELTVLADDLEAAGLAEALLARLRRPV